MLEMLGEMPVPVPLFSFKSRMDCPGIKPGHLGWDAYNWQPKTWHGVVNPLILKWNINIPFTPYRKHGVQTLETLIGECCIEK
jgi:hypothetical protein